MNNHEETTHANGRQRLRMDARVDAGAAGTGRLLTLERLADVTEMTGVGVVAAGVQFFDDTVAVLWASADASAVLWSGLDTAARTRVRRTPVSSGHRSSSPSRPTASRSTGSPSTGSACRPSSTAISGRGLGIALEACRHDARRAATGRRAPQ